MPRGIYERDDLPVREKEGLPQIRTCVYGEVLDEIVIREHDAKMLVSIASGQKTGHFLDQQENRGRLKPYAPGRTCLTCAAARAAFRCTLRFTARRASRQSHDHAASLSSDQALYLKGDILQIV